MQNMQASPYQTALIPKVPIREHYRSAPSNKLPNFIGLALYWRTMFVIARTYDASSEDLRNSAKCFYQSLSEIIPESEFKYEYQAYLTMTPEIQKTLLESPLLSSFFLVHKEIKNSLEENPEQFFDFSLQSANLLFKWVFLFYAYHHLAQKQNFENFSSARVYYDRTNINKEFWANAVWFVIHHSARNTSAVLNKTWSLAYKAFICCLMWMLPCQICKKHLRENLPKRPIDPFLVTNESIFEWGWGLHNIVSKSINKAPMGLNEAMRLYEWKYAPMGQPTSTFV